MYAHPSCGPSGVRSSGRRTHAHRPGLAADRRQRPPCDHAPRPRHTSVARRPDRLLKPDEAARRPRVGLEHGLGRHRDGPSRRFPKARKFRPMEGEGELDVFCRKQLRLPVLGLVEVDETLPRRESATSRRFGHRSGAYRPGCPSGPARASKTSTRHDARPEVEAVQALVTPGVIATGYCVERRGVSQLTSYVISAFGLVGRGLPRRERPSVDRYELTGVPVSPTLPPTEENSAGWRAPCPHRAGGRAAASLLAALLAVVLSVVGLDLGATTAAVSPAHSPETAEEAGAEETTDSRRTGTRHRRRQVARSSPKPRQGRRHWSRSRPRWRPTLVVPISCTPRRGPPLLTC